MQISIKQEKDQAVIFAQNPRYESGVPEVNAFTASTWCSSHCALSTKEQ